ncbi:MAG: asparagine synthase (glutamine-hydrolyzing) [Gammaproteobacteria bacterium]|nr:asparagine synthase (glutamine-hydrolyzing) [Gammaproteobacteria bacterium]
MCGIAGFLDTKHRGNEPRRILLDMTQKLIHRGPDDGDIWLNEEDGIALGQRRLAIIDLTVYGHQPMHSACGRYVIVYNGEIYNYLDLQKNLIAEGHTFKGHSDTEVILTLIASSGLESALKLMTGMFAFALWDKKEKILHLARDRIGEKPLYYGHINGTLVFASELKAIRAFPNFQNEIATQSLSLLLQYGYISAPYSIYKNIYKLTPGNYISFDASISANSLPPLKTYWSAFDVARTGISNLLTLSDDEAIQQVDTMLHGIVKDRMISDVPIGALLSGGIDSSLITALMQANSTRPIKTFTIGFNEKSYNEAQYAKAIAQHLGTDHTELYVDSAHALTLIPHLPEIYDEPFGDSSAIPTFLVSQLTRKSVTVALSGDGGDEVFGGYNRYLITQQLWKKISLLPYPLRQIAQKLLLSLPPKYWDKLLRFTPYPMIGDKLHKLAAVLGAKSPLMLYNLLVSQWYDADTVVIHRDSSESIAHPSLAFIEQFNEGSIVERMMLTDTISYLPDDIMVKVDRAGMAVSLETRAPYLDHHLIEFMWQLPMQMKIRQKETKWLLRKILMKHVSQSLFERPKMGFGVPLDSWLRGPLRDWAESLLDKSLIERQGFLRAEPIAKKWQEHLSGKRNRQHLLWNVLMFQGWLQNEG